MACVIRWEIVLIGMFRIFGEPLPVHWSLREERPTDSTMKTVERQILELFEDGDRALMAADVAELSRIFAEDYIQCDEHGTNWSRRDVIENLASGKTRYISMVSTGRLIRILREDVAVVNGSEDDEVERDGEHFPVRYSYLDVVMKRDGQWRIVASQLTRKK